MPADVRHRADAVFEGGGVKGIAFAGAIAAAERDAGVQEWVNVAGTSAGAIVAALLVAGYDAAGLQKILASAKYPRFADTGPGGKWIGGIGNAVFRLRGMAPGRYFHEWMTEQLEASPLAKELGKTGLTFADVKRRDLPPKEQLEEITDLQYERTLYRLHVIGSDITTGRMMILPDDLPDYTDEAGKPFDKDTFLLVDAVRMSMSYPFLFNPVVLHRQGRPVYVVDGGLLSNFPIWLFDSPHPTRPTWGFRLHGGTSVDEGLPYRKIPRPFWEVPLLKAMFSAATEAWDREQLSQATSSRTVSIPTHQISTTNFELTPAEVDSLYAWGLNAAHDFFTAPEQKAYVNSFGRSLSAPAPAATVPEQAMAFRVSDIPDLPARPPAAPPLEPRPEHSGDPAPIAGAEPGDVGENEAAAPPVQIDEGGWGNIEDSGASVGGGAAGGDAASAPPSEPSMAPPPPAPAPPHAPRKVAAAPSRRTRSIATAVIVLGSKRLIRGGRRSDETLMSGAALAPDLRPVVNTGFAESGQPGDFLRPDAPLRPDRDYWFSVEIGQPVLFALGDTVLPTDLLPEKARLYVALFGFPGEIAIDTEHDAGELELLDNGEVVVTEQPLPDLVGVPHELAERRLFFPIRTPPRRGRYRLRLNIYCAGVLVQSRLISAQVAKVQIRRRTALREQLEYTISQAIEPATLNQFPPHKLSLMLNGPGDGSHSFRVFAEDGEARIKTDADFQEAELTDLISTARASLREVSWGDANEWATGKTFRYGDGGLDLQKLCLDLGRLARSGYRLYRLLVHNLRDAHTPEAFESLMAEPGYVQLAAQDSRMLVPLALFYDYFFDSTANLARHTLCDVFTEALTSGEPLETLSCLDGACPHRGEDTVICPSGFWGYRHFIGMPLSSTLDVHPFLTRTRPPRVVFGSANDLDRRAQHEAQLDRLGATMVSSHTRAELLDRLRGDSAQLVYLYCHGGLKETQPYLLVGSGSDGPITRDYLYGRIKWATDRPLVVINGCHTTAVRPDQAFDLVSGFIQESNAMGVVGTEVTIGEALACAFGEEFINRFAIRDETLGQAMRNTRLALLGKGNPLGLVYTPFALAGLRMTDPAAPAP